MPATRPLWAFFVESLKSTDMSEHEHVVIVGGGQAALSVATELRRLKHACRITILAEESLPPYRRPPLSKGFLLGEMSTSRLLIRDAKALAAADIHCRTDCRVAAIDRPQKVVELADGERVAYTQLVLATGGSARSLPLPGADAPNVLTLRNVADVQRLQTLCADAKRVAIIGGGFIGLELAAVLAQRGLKTSVFEAMPRLLQRAASPRLSAFVEGLHRKHGVAIHTGANIVALEGRPRVSAVQLADGSTIPVDFVVVGVGLVPRVELAVAAGLAAENGITVDAHCRTADASIYAVGDCSNHPSSRYGQRLRLESVQNAQDQGRVAARNIAGTEVPYDNLPWFWSDQYDAKLQMAGLRIGDSTEVVRGDGQEGSGFAVLHLRDGVLVAAETVNRAADFLAARKLIEAGTLLDSAVLADEATPLAALLS